MTAINIYKLPQVVTVFRLDKAAGDHMITSFHHTRTDFKLFRGVRNEIDFFIRNYDRKPVSVADPDTVVLTLSDRRNRRVVGAFPLTALDAAKGHYQLVIDATAAEALDMRWLAYAVTLNTAAGRHMLFVDRDHGVSGTIEVVDGPEPAAREPQTLRWDEFLKRDAYYYAGTLEGPALTASAGTNTVTFAVADFVGEVTIEATQQPMSPMHDGDWEMVQSQSFGASRNEPVVLTFNSTLYTWVRFRVRLDSGTVSSVTYLN